LVVLATKKTWKTKRNVQKICSLTQVAENLVSELKRPTCYIRSKIYQFLSYCFMNYKKMTRWCFMHVWVIFIKNSSSAFIKVWETLEWKQSRFTEWIPIKKDSLNFLVIYPDWVSKVKLAIHVEWVTRMWLASAFVP